MMLDIRQRTGWLFTAVVLAQLVLISAQVTTKTGVPMLEVAVFGTVAEVQRVATGLMHGHERPLAAVRVAAGRPPGKRAAAHPDGRAADPAAAGACAGAGDAHAPGAPRPASAQTKLATISAAVIAGAASPDFRTLTIDKGTRQGVQTDMAVIAPAGIVGRVITPTPARPRSSCSSIATPPWRAWSSGTRAQGLVVGTGGDRLEMDYVPGNGRYRAGDRVVTSGIDGIYPKGFADWSDRIRAARSRGLHAAWS